MMEPRNDDEDAALVDSFFLPGGILDPDDDDEEREGDAEDRRTAYVPFSFQRSGAPSQNPWETPPGVSHPWNEQAEPPAIGGSDGDGLIGNGSCEPARILTGPLHKSDALHEPSRISTGPLHELDAFMHFASNYRSTHQSPELLYPDWNMHTQSTEPFERTDLDAMSVRAPPGFAESVPTASIPTAAGVKAVDEQHRYDEDSLRSDSSVPHELFERDSYTGSSASSLSGLSVDEVSSPHSSSSHVDEITQNELSSPRSSSHRYEITENELSSPRSSLHRDESTENNATQHDDISARLEGHFEDQVEETREGYVEVDENAAMCADTVPSDSPVARKTKKSYRDVLKDEKTGTAVRKTSTISTFAPPVSIKSTMDNSNIGSASPTEISTPAKLRNQQRGKAKSTAAPQSASTVCARPSFYQTCGRISLEWILTNVQGMLRYLLMSMHAWAQAIVACCRFTIPFWMRLFRLLQRVLFTILYCGGILISICVLVYKSALLEAVQETRVSLCYAVLYFFPVCISVLMANFALPHFTPHLVSCALLYGFCHSEKRQNETTQQRHGAENVRSGYNAPTLSDKTKSRTARPKHETSNARQTCRTILRYARFNLPIIFFLEGFSNELGVVMSLGGSGRLMSAYTLTILRKGLLFSPIAWLGSALQLLIASHLRWMPSIDLLIVGIGLASIRFSQFLENCVSAKTMKAKGS